MTIGELRSLVRKGESDHLEFKKKVDYPEKVVREIIAFANTNGGNLLIGVDDNGTISGLKYPEEEKYVLEKALSEFCKPLIPFHVNQIPVNSNKAVLIYSIDRSEKRPHYFKNSTKQKEAYVRIGDKSIKASRELIEIIERQRKGKDIQFTFGESEKILMKHLERNGFITIDTFALIANLKPFQAARKLILLVLANVLVVVPGERHDQFELKKIIHINGH